MSRDQVEPPAEETEQPAMAWPEEPWVLGIGDEAECVFQSGEVEPLAVVDPWRNLSEAAADAIARRIRDCVNACAGIADPAAEIAAMRALIWTLDCELARLGHRFGLAQDLHRILLAARAVRAARAGSAGRPEPA